MLRKTLTGTEIMEMIKKQIREEGLEFISVTGGEDFYLDCTLEMDVKVKPAQKSNLHFPDGVRSVGTPTLPNTTVGGRGILDTPVITSSIGDDPGLRSKMQRLKERREGSSYFQTGPSKLRSTFYAEQGENREALLDLPIDEDFKPGGTA